MSLRRCAVGTLCALICTLSISSPQKLLDSNSMSCEYDGEKMPVPTKRHIKELKEEKVVQAKRPASRGSDINHYTINGVTYKVKSIYKCVATYYSTHPSENGGYGGTASGKPFTKDTVAIPSKDPSGNSIPLGTKIIFIDEKGKAELRVGNDRGGAIKFQGNTMRIDLLVMSSDTKYVNSLGVKKGTVLIIE